jgi:hypothetical protein
VLRLGEQVGHGERPTADHERRVEWDPAGAAATIDADAALGEVAEPLVGMALAHGASLLHDRQHAR